jgi:hypothetical protein
MFAVCNDDTADPFFRSTKIEVWIRAESIPSIHEVLIALNGSIDSKCRGVVYSPRKQRDRIVAIEAFQIKGVVLMISACVKLMCAGLK